MTGLGTRYGMRMISSLHHQISRFKELSFVFIRANLGRRQCSTNNDKTVKFRELIKDGPSLGDFIQSSSTIKQLRLKREDDEPR